MIRRIEIPGLYNLRDTGGYRAGDATTRWGKLFRSDALHRLEGPSRDAFGQIGIRHIIDLRSDNERAHAPNMLEGLSVEVHNLPVFAAAAPRAQVYNDITLDRLYEHIIDERADRIIEAVRTIANAAPDEAVLVHCMAGKDRTGLVVAFALSAVGVEREDVVNDYAETEQHLAGEWTELMLQRMGVEEPSEAMLSIVSTSPAEVMARVLERVDREFGSATDYLTRNGLSVADVDRLGAALVR